MGKLCLSRKRGESIVLTTPPGLSETILIEVYQVVGNKVYLRIAAPDNVKVMRLEVLYRKPKAGGAA